MVLRIFETDDAKYYLGLGNHISSSAPLFEEVDFSELDFLVLEDSGVSPDFLKNYLEQDQYRELYRRICTENANCSIYGVDCHSNLFLGSTSETLKLGAGFYVGALGIEDLRQKRTVSRRHFLRGGLRLAGGIVLGSFPFPFFYSFSPDVPPLRYAHDLSSTCLPTLTEGFRDAVTAKKVAEHLVPKHRQEGKKVQAALLYGAGHSGMETKLKHPEIADATIGLYHDLLGLCSNEELNRVLEIRHNSDGDPIIKAYSCDIF